MKRFRRRCQEALARLIRRSTQQAGLRDTAIYLGDHTALTRTVHGHDLFVDTRDVSLAPHLLLRGDWEPHVTRVFLDVVKPGMTVVEVGANVGFYTVLAADRVGTSGKVIAFEANPDLTDLVFRSLCINGYRERVELVNQAVTDRVGRVPFHRLSHFLGGSSLRSRSAEFVRLWREEVDTIDVQATSLDAFFADRAERIDVMKIDAEGAEPRIFAGMKSILAAHPDLQIICEMNAHMVADTLPPAEFLGRLTGDGWVLRIIERRGDPRRATPEQVLAAGHCELYLRRG